jgi:serine/threonine protein kinase
LLKFEGVFETDHSFYLILEVLKGGNLLEYLMRRKTFLNIEETRTIMRNLVKGLAELEKHEVVHRDIKLENVMLRDKDSLEPVIVDFGLAVYFWEDDYVFKNCGTPGYLSPEVIKSENGSRITTKSDVFSAGVVLHVLLTGRYLFNGKDPRSVFESNR